MGDAGQMRHVGIALIGAGSIGDYHLAGLAHVRGASVRVIASRTLAAARALADRYAIADATDDVSAAMTRDDVDAILIATPDDTHEALAIAAMRAGRAVLLQKPMAPTAQACRRILNVAAQNGCDLQVSWMHRHFEEVAMARALLAQGRIGKVTTVRIRNATPGPDWGDWFFRSDVVSAGVVLQLGIHGIDLTSVMFGRIGAVSARLSTMIPTRRLRDGRTVAVENPDTALAVYETSSGALVHHEMSMIEPCGTDRFRMEIYGTEGTMWLRTERGPLASVRTGESSWTIHAVPDAPLGRRHHQDWIDGLTGQAPRGTTALDGLQSLLVADAIAASSARGGCRQETAELTGASSC